VGSDMTAHSTRRSSRVALRREACDSEVRGMAYRTGEHHFVLEPGDPLGLGFTLR